LKVFPLARLRFGSREIFEQPNKTFSKSENHVTLNVGPPADEARPFDRSIATAPMGRFGLKNIVAEGKSTLTH